MSSSEPITLYKSTLFSSWLALFLCLYSDWWKVRLTSSSLLAVLGKKKKKAKTKIFSFLVAPEKILGLLWLEQRVINRSPWPDHSTDCPDLGHELSSDSRGWVSPTPTTWKESTWSWSPRKVKMLLKEHWVWNNTCPPSSLGWLLCTLTEKPEW